MFTYHAFEFDVMDVTLLSLFRTLLKETEAAENIHFDAAIGDHPEGAIDAEVARIVSENTTDPDGLETAETIVGASMGGTNQA
jgi:hypothetical protein